MKTFSTSGTGSGQTLSEIESDKMPIYDSLTDVEADLANLSVGQIVATKDTGDELAQPVDVVESGNLHAVSSDAVAESLSYSTTEQKTGGVWIDGKPIYRKVISKIESSSGTFSYDITSIIDVVDKFVGFRVLQKQSSSTVENFVEGNFHTNYNTYSSYINIKEKKISYTTTLSVTTTLYFILEYTKTTD